MWPLIALVLLASPADDAATRTASEVLAKGGYQVDLPVPPPPRPRPRLPLGGGGGGAGRSGPGAGASEGTPTGGGGADGAGAGGEEPAGDAGGAGGEGSSGPGQAEGATEPPQTQPPHEVPPPPPPVREPATTPASATPSAGIPQALPWILFALCTVAALIVAFRSRGEPVAEEAAGAPARPEPRKVDAALPDPHALAAAGRYAEAIHALLLTALADVARRAKGRASEGLTGRELLQAAAPRGVQLAVQPLLTAVERTHFGGEPASAEDFARCREQARAVQAAWRS
jgi:hypothetical protein